MLNEELFPGNTNAFDLLQDVIATKKVTLFTGAGTSSPLYPGWSSLLNEFLKKCIDGGYIVADQDIAAIREQINNDPLEAANSLEDTLSRKVFRASLANRFSDIQECTEAHRALVGLNPQAIVTLNYERGLEVATVKTKGVLPNSLTVQNRAEIAKWMQGELQNAENPPVLHLHGLFSSPDDMVFTGDDYDAAYSDDLHNRLIQQLWLSDRLLVVGFGFIDPFLTRMADRTLRSMTVDNRHYAIIGKREGAAISRIIRNQFSRKYRCTPIFYRIKVTEDGVEDHSDLTTILHALKPTPPTPTPGKETLPSANADTSTKVVASETSAQQAAKDFSKNLFFSPRGQPLYVEPRFVEPHATPLPPDVQPEFISIEAIIEDTANYTIGAPSEYGGSTLARRLHKEFSARGATSYLRDAHQLASYRRKLQQEFPQHASGAEPKAILIIDEFNGQENERLIKEIEGLSYFSRIITIFKPSSRANVSEINTSFGGKNYKVLALHHLTRPDFRELATQLFDSSDEDLISAVVDKVYTDLLDLCIPLTPFNAIMYLNVLYREGDFYPISRVQIMEQYLQGLLKSSSDALPGSFSSGDKLKIVSSFVHDLHLQRKGIFSEEDWNNFCDNYVKKSLTRFDFRGLLRELIRERMLVNWDDRYFFKYRFFYVYFLGKHVANRPRQLKEMLSADSHLSISGLVEVISALADDNEVLVDHLITDAKSTLSAFEDQYKLGNSDPFEDMSWPQGEKEEERFWLPLAEKVEKGPAKAHEVDELKTTLLAETRTRDQSVVYQKFDLLERRLILSTHCLIDALIGGEIADGNRKKEAVQLIQDAYMIIYQVGLLMSPALAANKYVYWNGILFHGSSDAPQDESETKRRTILVALEMAGNVSLALANILGTRKLGEVYSSLVPSQDVAFKRLSLYSLLLKSKPDKWNEIAEGMLEKTDRNSLYIRGMLSITFFQFNQEVNTGYERGQLKRLIAYIRAKRGLKKDSPGSKLVGRVLKRLEKVNHFTGAGPASKGGSSRQ